MFGVQIVAGAYLILAAGPWWWFRAALGLNLYGSALWSLAFNDAFESLRRLLRLQQVVAMHLTLGVKSLAGVVATVGALVSLDPAPGLIAAFFTVSWAWLWGYLLRQSLRDTGEGAHDRS